MNLVDVIIVAAALISALVGFRHGFVIAAGSLVGFLAGSWVGIQLAPLLLGNAPPVFSTAAVALIVVFVAGSIGSMLGSFVGRRVRALITWRPGRLVDASAGAAVGITYVLLFGWAIGVTVGNAGLSALSSTLQRSVVLGAVNQALPDGSDRNLVGLSRLLDSSGFPTVFAPFNNEYIPDADPARVEESVTAAVRLAARSVVRVQGEAAACSATMTGSGWVYADDLVATNAHVVAGVESPNVLDPTEGWRPARVVWFDPGADIAILRVDDLDTPALGFGGALPDGAAATVIGYPGGGDQSLEAARVRTQRTIIGPDIYGHDQVERQVYSLRTHVLPGDSGGPLVSPEGVVVGIVFAASIDDDETGYAFTADQARPSLESGLTASETVSTGACA